MWRSEALRARAIRWGEVRFLWRMLELQVFGQAQISEHVKVRSGRAHHSFPGTVGPVVIRHISMVPLVRGMSMSLTSHVNSNPKIELLRGPRKA